MNTDSKVADAYAEIERFQEGLISISELAAALLAIAHRPS